MTLSEENLVFHPGAAKIFFGAILRVAPDGVGRTRLPERREIRWFLPKAWAGNEHRVKGSHV